MDATDLRRVMSHWTTGVGVVTSVGPRGCTANALTSLSLSPPLVLVCLDLGSNTLEAVRRTGLLGVNVLAAGQEALARTFSRKCLEDEKFEAVPHRLVDGVPVLEGCLAWLVCAAERELEGGDHAILLARPLRGGLDPDGEPLVFFRSGYRQTDASMLGV